MKPTLLRCSSLFVALALAGCAVGPDYLRPTSAPSVEFKQAAGWKSAAPADTALRGDWWTLYDDPELDALIARLNADNQNLASAEAKYRQAQALVRGARSSFFPTLGLNTGVTRAGQGGGDSTIGTTGGVSVSGANASTVSKSYEASLGVSWELDLWGKLRRQDEAARAQLIASEEGRRGVLLTLVSGVAGAYVNLRDLDRQLEIASDTARTREASYRLFQDRYAGGLISILELSQNKSQYDEALARIPALEQSIALQENALSALLGRNPGPIARGKNIDELSPPVIPEGLPSTLLERRPDLRAAEQQLIAANALIGAARAAYYPSISLTGVFGVASGSLSNLFSGASKVWQYAGAVNLPIFTAGKIDSQVEIAEAQQQQALFSYQKAIQTAFREVNDALIAQDRTRAQLEAQGQQVKSLQEYTDTARLRYDNGYTSYLEVLDAERGLFQAQLQYAQTQQKLLQAMIDLYKAMGGGWPEGTSTASTTGESRPNAAPGGNAAPQ